MQREPNIRPDEVVTVMRMWYKDEPMVEIVRETGLSRHSVNRIVQFYKLFDEAGYIK